MPAHVNRTSASISGTVSSARAAYPQSDDNGVLVYNSGIVPVFVNSGDVTVTAATTNQFVPAGATRYFERKPTDTYLAAITASSTATVYFVPETP